MNKFTNFLIGGLSVILVVNKFFTDIGLLIRNVNYVKHSNIKHTLMNDLTVFWKFLINTIQNVFNTLISHPEIALLFFLILLNLKMIICNNRKYY